MESMCIHRVWGLGFQVFWLKDITAMFWKLGLYGVYVNRIIHCKGGSG